MWTMSSKRLGTYAINKYNATTLMIYAYNHFKEDVN